MAKKRPPPMIDPRADLIVVTLRDDWGRVLGQSARIRVVRHGPEFYTFEDQSIPVPVLTSGVIDRIEGELSGRDPYQPIWIELPYRPGRSVRAGQLVTLDSGPLCAVRE